MKKKHVYRNFFLTIIICAIIGGIIGYISVSAADDIRSNVNHLIAHLSLNLPLIGCAVVAILLIVSLFFYFKASRLCRIAEFSDSDDALEAFERASEQTVVVLNLLIVAACTFFALIAVQTAQKNDLSSILSGVVMVVAGTGISILLTIQLFRLIKRVEREITVHPLESDFQKKWLAASDEAERFILFKGAWRTLRIMQIIYLILLFGSIVISNIFPIGIEVPLLVGLLWMVQTTLLSIFSMQRA